jgi:hypothetical protein
VISFSQLKFLYISWGQLLAMDHSASFGLSVDGWLKSWFSININKTVITLTGAALFCLPLLRIKEYANYSFRLLMLCSVLLWVVIFNHKAESPTFIIAMSGASIWFFSQPLKTENLILFLFAFVFTSLSTTDIFPLSMRRDLFIPYAVKAVPCILIWFKVLYDQLFTKSIQLQPEAQRFGITI